MNEIPTGTALHSTAENTLRRRLQEITDESEGGSFDDLTNAIDGLAATCPHNIERREDEYPDYRCFVHAFDLTSSDLYRSVAYADCVAKKNKFFAGRRFTAFLISESKLVEVTRDQVAIGDVAIYFDDQDAPTHAGKICSNELRIRSKWGGGLLLDHDIWEVPQSYGQTVRFFKGVSPSQAERAFVDFLHSNEDFAEFAKRWHLKDVNER